MLYIGVDLGGTGIKAGVVNERGEILSKGSTPTMKERPYQAIIRDIAALCEDVAKQANVAMADIAAIGVGVPGICDPKTGIIPFCTNLGWHEVPFVAEMGKYLPNRVVVDNDATVAGYAESIAGVSKGTKSSVFITLGTGVGGGTLLGLSRKMIGVDDINHFEQLSEGGNLDNIDLRIKDISGDKSFQINEEITASNFGKLSDIANKNDIALGIANMIGETIAMLSVFAARNFDTKTVVLTGNLTTIRAITRVFEGLASSFGVRFLIPEQAQFATVIGAALCDGDN